MTPAPQQNGSDAPEGSKKLRWTHPAFIGGVAGIVAAIIFGIGLQLSLTAADDDETKGIYASLPGPLFTFAGAVVITGVVGVWVSAAAQQVEQQRREAERRLEQQRRDAEGSAEREREHRAFIESQIVALWRVHECMKTSAVLLSAHRTATTYREQIRQIIAARTRLSSVQDTVKRQRGPLVTEKDFAEFQGHVETAAAFLHPLVDEYRKNYLEKLSYAQRMDDAQNRQLDDTANFDPQARSSLVWTTLREDPDFSAVQKLLDFGDLSADDLRVGSTSWEDAAMTKEFFQPLTMGIDVLVACAEPSARHDNTPAAAEECDTREATAILWDEYSYRHDMIWKLVFRVTAVATALAIPLRARCQSTASLEGVAWVASCSRGTRISGGVCNPAP